jgi:hypothetical protein
VISFPAFFFALSSVALLAALAAIWSSIRSALGGGPRVAIETSRDLPDHAALNDEKASLLRAIKDLEYEHAVGKIGEADFARLDAAYRARAKQVLVQLDRDVKPLYEEAERLIAARLAGEKPVRSKSKKKRKEGEPAAAEETPADDRPLLDRILARIRAGEILEPPAPPEDWPAEAKRFFVDAVRRAIDETRAKSEAADETAAKSDAADETAARSDAVDETAAKTDAADEHVTAVVGEPLDADDDVDDAADARRTEDDR